MIELSDSVEIKFPEGGPKGELVKLKRLEEIVPNLKRLASLPTDLRVSVLNTRNYCRIVEIAPDSFGYYYSRELTGELPKYRYRVIDWYHESLCEILGEGKNSLTIERWYDEELNEISKKTQIGYDGKITEERLGKVTRIIEGGK